MAASCSSSVNEAAVDVAADAPIRAVFAHLAQDVPRTYMIATAVREQYEQGRKVLALTERTDHLESLQQALAETVQPLFVLHGRLAKKIAQHSFLPFTRWPVTPLGSYWRPAG